METKFFLGGTFPERTLPEWKVIIHQLTILHSAMIQCCYLVMNVNDTFVKCELYLRGEETVSGIIKCTLIVWKSRVALVKSLSILRLNIMGTPNLARFYTIVNSQHHFWERGNHQ